MLIRRADAFPVTGRTGITLAVEGRFFAPDGREGKRAGKRGPAAAGVIVPKKSLRQLRGRRVRCFIRILPSSENQCIAVKNLLLLLLPLTLIACSETRLNGQVQNPRHLPWEWKTDTSRRTVPLSELTMVLPRGSFPAIDYPAFIGQKEGLELFYRYEPVLALAIDGQAKAWPLNMLTMHEISNDTLAGIPILPTYCPLCNAGLVFDRRLDGQVLEFEVSGMLRRSDMIMADRQTESWWQQLTGEGLAGKYAGRQLRVLPSLIISVEEFFARYPQGRILSPATGTRAAGSYGSNPYVGYDDPQGRPYGRFFPSAAVDDRLPPMERVIDVAGQEGHRIYPFSVLQEQGVINDTYDGRPLVVFYSGRTVSVLDRAQVSESRAVGSATVFNRRLGDRELTFRRGPDGIVDEQTGSRWDITGRATAGLLQGQQLEPVRHGNHFAFAWLSFYPDSEVYKP